MSAGGCIERGPDRLTVSSCLGRHAAANGEFLLGYGVTFPDNPDDLASTGMKIEGGSLPASEQAELAATGLSIDEIFWMALDDDVPDDLFRLIRILMGCKDHQRMSIDQLVAASQVPTSSDSMRFEACVWAAAKETKAMLVLTKLLASNAQSAFKRKKKNEQAAVGPQIRARVKEQDSHYLKGECRSCLASVSRRRILILIQQANGRSSTACTIYPYWTSKMHSKKSVQHVWIRMQCRTTVQRDIPMQTRTIGRTDRMQEGMSRR